MLLLITLPGTPIYESDLIPKRFSLQLTKLHELFVMVTIMPESLVVI
jgi:hypothetical protein